MASGSVTHWIEQIKAGSESVAEQQLWQRYFLRLVALARRKLDGLPAHSRDDEEMALSVLNALFTRARRGCFPQVHDRSDLWQLLAKITVRKSIDQRRKARAQKRGCRQVHGAGGFDDDLQNLAGADPAPDIIAAVDEECRRLMNALDQELQAVARMKLEGYTNREIADSMDRVERTVERKLERIRKTWLKAIDAS